MNWVPTFDDVVCIPEVGEGEKDVHDMPLVEM